MHIRRLIALDRRSFHSKASHKFFHGIAAWGCRFFALTPLVFFDALERVPLEVVGCVVQATMLRIVALDAFGAGWEYHVLPPLSAHLAAFVNRNNDSAQVSRDDLIYRPPSAS